MTATLPNRAARGRADTTRTASTTPPASAPTTGTETPAQRATREWADRPRPEHRPHDYAAETLERLGDVRTSTAADLAAVRAIDLELAEAAAALERLPDPAGDQRRQQHAEARQALEAWLRPMRDGSPDQLEELPHAPDCADDRREVSEHRAPSGYGVLTVRTWRCLGCGAQAVVNRRVILAPNRDAEQRQRRYEARANAGEPHFDPKPWRRP